ncbi:MAG: IS4 family transposase [Roseiflexus sp.]|uniref:IS4 family transposase n=1 Tax=Roseiflexus sp. TaxID=2562120 RepID=UPI0025E0DD27|nr:IS4 family transposase [Roseiflexus sp.]MCL6543543.1 IS4 family transposase [Roseiflexus sp.]
MNKFCSIFSQILQLFPRFEFQQLVKETRAERHARGFSCWSQFVSMLFCQLGRANSLREIAGGLRSCEGKLKHLGISAPSHSTLAYANEHRPWVLYQQLFLKLFDRCRAQVGVGKKKFRFKNKLMGIDSSIIDLCLAIFDWAHFRRTKGAIKLHLILDHDGYLPSFAVITEGKVADVKIAKQLKFDPGTIIVYDRAYIDYELFGRWTAQGVYFVTRMKENCLYEAVGEREVPKNRNILKDEMIELRGYKALEKCPFPLRRIEVFDPETEMILVFLTNNLDLGATTIAAIYKDRWQMEIFFKAIKQNLKIKTFVGTSPNAVKIQIWTALIAMLILRFLQLQAKFNWSLSNLLALLRLNLFTHRDLWAWLNKPFETPPVPYEPEQLRLNFA